jgi:hypothetical protein
MASIDAPTVSGQCLRGDAIPWCAVGSIPFQCLEGRGEAEHVDAPQVGRPETH